MNTDPAKTARKQRTNYKGIDGESHSQEMRARGYKRMKRTQVFTFYTDMYKQQKKEKHVQLAEVDSVTKVLLFSLLVYRTIRTVGCRGRIVLCHHCQVERKST